MTKTAAELLKELASDDKHIAMKKEKDKKFSQLEKIYAQDENELVEELNQAGYQVSSVWDFVNSDNYYIDAAPILIKHLKIDHHPKTISGLARSLAIPELSNNTELWDLLVSLYDKTPPNSEIEIPENRGAQESISVALRNLATKERVNSLRKLVSRNLDGDGVSWLEDKIKEMLLIE